jgi:hypothetical protein
MKRSLFCGLLLLTATANAFAQQRCIVDDPSPTPLNVRSEPYGRILGALHNGTEVVILDWRRDRNGQSWVLIRAVRAGTSGWVYRSYLDCR